MIHHDAETHQEDDPSKPIYDSDGNVIGYEQMTVVDKEDYDEVIKQEEGHWDYEEGWREGDFVYEEPTP